MMRRKRRTRITKCERIKIWNKMRKTCWRTTSIHRMTTTILKQKYKK
jgi:hypothetical protein